jgi:sigma-B regulation protein RsbU (phosphoserine phosphatase)
MKELLLRRVPLFAAIPPDELKSLTAELRHAAYPAGTLLLREDDRGDRFYIILSGQVAIIKALGTPNERLLGLRGAGEFVGEMSLLNLDGLRSASVRVIADTQVLEVTHDDFDRLLQRYPMMAYDMLRAVSTRRRESDDAMIRDIQEKNEQLASAYADLEVQNQRLARAYADLAAAQAQLIEKEALERELRLAREIQESILPRRLPALPGIDVGARMVTAREVGGDFFDAFPLGAHQLGLVVGDACGKGMPAAIFMALTRSLLRAEASRATSPEVTLRNVNRHLQDMNDAGMFITVLYGIFRSATRQFAYARAGHELPLACGPSHELLAPPRAHGHPLGLFPEPALDVQTMRLPPGGTLLLYTDGVTEATDAQGDFFGLERTGAALRAHQEAPAQSLCDRLVDDLALFRGAAPQADDITLLALRTR